MHSSKVNMPDLERKLRNNSHARFENNFAFKHYYYYYFLTTCLATSRGLERCLIFKNTKHVQFLIERKLKRRRIGYLPVAYHL